MAGKKHKKAGDSSSTATSTQPKTATVKEERISLGESLERALNALEASQQHMLSLHRSWRSQLLRMIVLVLVLVLKQASIPSSDCIVRVNEWNERITNDSVGSTDIDENNISPLFIGHWEAGKYCIADSLMEISGVLCCLSLIWLLCQPLTGDDFTCLPFRSSIFFVPLIVGSYYQKPIVNCLGDLASNNGGIENEGADPGKPRTFPVVLIMLLVCFGSLYAMQYQQKQQTENIQKVEKLREDLLKGNKKKN